MICIHARPFAPYVLTYSPSASTCFLGSCVSTTDVGDVSWQTPVGQIHVAAWPNGCPGHSWQNVSCAGSDLGFKAAVHAGKVLACAVIDLMTQPELLSQARAEFEKATKAGYTCPIPADALPVIPD